MLTIKCAGSYRHTTKFLRSLEDIRLRTIAEKYGKLGVDALSQNTPVDSGLTSSSWRYDVETRDGVLTITWSNTNLGQGWAPIALLLQYGHGTRNGGYVEGRDYINPTMKPIFDEIADKAWKEVTDS